MFTGLITHLGKITNIEHIDDIQLTISSAITDWCVGESVAINGCCLTVTTHHNQTATFTLSTETMQATNFNDLATNDWVNIERALKVGDRMGGHFVTGHIDQTATIDSITPEKSCYILHIGGITPQNHQLCVSKGSICINGISLTINQVIAKHITVCIIPHTWEMTNMQHLNTQALVNLEFDYLAKFVIQQQHKQLFQLQDNPT